MTRTLALVVAVVAGEVQAQEPILLEKIGAVHMSQPDELRRRDVHDEMWSLRPGVPPYGLAGKPAAAPPSR